MKRLHVHVAVDSVVDSIQFYSGMFGGQPAVVKPDYAKWMLEDPRVNFAISRRGAETGLNHLGIQVESAAELEEMQARLESLQPKIVKEEDVACCYAKSDKYWLTDPSGIQWETFHTLDSIPVFGETEKAESKSCCIPLAQAQAELPCCVPTQQSASSSKCC